MCWSSKVYIQNNALIKSNPQFLGSGRLDLKIKTENEKKKTKMYEKHGCLIKVGNRQSFFVDAAYSVLSKDNIRYWKGVLVNQDKELVYSFVNSKVIGAAGAEAYAILGAVYWFIKNKLTDKIIIFSDNMACVKALKGEKALRGEGRKFWLDKHEKTHFHKYIHVIRKLIRENSLNIKFELIKGKYNPADYYSRIDYKWHKPKSQGKKMDEKV